MSWIDFLKVNAEKFEAKIALKEQSTGVSLSYRQLEIQTNQWANFLVKNEVKKGDRVVFINTNSLEHVTLLIACAKLGAIFVPMNWRLGPAEKEEIIKEVAPKLVLSPLDCQLNMHGHQFINLSSVDIGDYRKDLHVQPTSMQDPCLMLFTSGSTGHPKGVLFHGEMLLSNQEQTINGWGLKADDITIVETPFFHTGGYNVLLLPLLYLGGTSILAEKFTTENFYKTVEEEKLTVYFGVPTMFQEIAKAQNFASADLSSLRFLISGGAYCPVELIKTYQDKHLVFKQGFGLTEVGPNCFLLNEKDAIRKIGSIGQPMPHSQVKLIKDGEEVGVNEVGELVIAGPHVCAGYFNKSHLFEESLYGIYFKTGDLARFDEEGYYYIVGRIKDMYISGGENVYPAEVEKRLISHPAITDAVVVPVHDQKWGEVGLAYYQGEDQLDLDELREYLNPLISRYKHPAYLKHMEHFPLLDNGKVNRNQLKQLANDLVNQGNEI